MNPAHARWARHLPHALAIVALALGVTPTAAAAEDPFDATVRADVAFAEGQLRRTASSLPTSAYPLRTDASGRWITTTGSTSWTASFFPGSLWFAYELTGDPAFRSAAGSRQAGIEGQKTLSRGDLGFRIFTSFGNAERLTNSSSARSVALTAAATLAQRYSPTVGAIRANWPEGSSTDFIVTSDVIPSLELLFWGARNGGQAAWRDIAIRHALRARTDHVRPDGGSYHVVNYSPSTGATKRRGTAQGAADASTWARGQAWLVYGFALAYRETGDARFLDSARQTADYFLRHLPADGVPYWDFQAPGIPNAPRDTSSTAVVASALLELAQRDPDASRRATHLVAARRLVEALSASTYLAAQTPGFAAILQHGTQNAVTGQGVDAGLTFGDYYFAEALTRLRRFAPTTPRLAIAEATASAHDGNRPANAVDGNLATRWSASGDGQWLRLDLGSEQTVTKVALAYHQGDARAGRFDVQLSSDGVAWTTVAGAVTSATTKARETYDVPDRPARYVRILGHGNSMNAFNSITEVDVH